MTSSMATKHRVTNLSSQFQVLQEQASHYKHLKTQTSHLKTILKNNGNQGNMNKSFAASQQGEMPPLAPNKIQKERTREINSQNKRLMMKLFEIIHSKSEINNPNIQEKSRPLRSQSELNKAKEEKKINDENLMLMGRLREVRPCVGNATTWKEHSQNYKKTLKRLQNFDSHNQPKAVLTLKSKYLTPTVQSYVEENYLSNDKTAASLGLNFPMKFVWKRSDFPRGSGKSGRSEERKKNSYSMLVDSSMPCGEEDRLNSNNFKRKAKNGGGDANEQLKQKDFAGIVQKIDYSKGYEDIPEQQSSENRDVNSETFFGIEEMGNSNRSSLRDNRQRQNKHRPKSEIKAAVSKNLGENDETLSFNNLEIIEDKKNLYKINAELINSIFREQDEDYNQKVVKMLEATYLNQQL